jgi:hypothetical protein
MSRVDLDDAKAQGHRVEARLGINQLQVADGAAGLVQRRPVEPLIGRDDDAASSKCRSCCVHRSPRLPPLTWQDPFSSISIDIMNFQCGTESELIFSCENEAVGRGEGLANRGRNRSWKGARRPMSDEIPHDDQEGAVVQNTEIDQQWADWLAPTRRHILYGAGAAAVGLLAGGAQAQPADGNRSSSG